jgi:hypothetical protein
MSQPDDTPFVPILTVMVDYGNAPFLWLVDHPEAGGVGGNVCDGTSWDNDCPMSEGLWRKFADWAIAFDHTAFYSDRFDDRDWDWLAFHALGLQLSRWLKEEVGNAYRVVYDKSGQDPNHRLDERTEILADGRLRSLPPLGGAFTQPRRFCRHIVSGGQTGADRAALDFAIAQGYTHGGWAPRGRQAEDGPIPLKYQLTALATGGYRHRTHRNVAGSDGTLILNLGDLAGGSLLTQAFARRMGKPLLVVPLDVGVTRETVVGVLAWLREHKIQTLNVAGPRESQRPGIYWLTGELLMAIDARVQAALRPWPWFKVPAHDGSVGLHDLSRGEVSGQGPHGAGIQGEQQDPRGRPVQAMQHKPLS